MARLFVAILVLTVFGAILIFFARQSEPTPGLGQDSLILAQSQAEAAKIKHPAERLSVLFDIATEYTDANNREAAIPLLNQCTALLRGVENPDNKYHWAIFLLELQGRNGDIDAAVETANSMESASRRDALIARIVQGAASAGLYDRALVLASKIEDSFWHDSSFDQIAIAQAERGKTQSALKTIENIQDLQLKRRAMLIIVISLLERSELENAITVMNGMDDSFHKIRALTDVAKCQFKNGDKATAKETFSQAEKLTKELNEPLLSIRTSALAEMEEFDSAIALAKTSSDEEERDGYFGYIARLQVERGFPDDALKTTELIDDAYRKDLIWKSVVVGQSKIGKFEEALQTLERIQNPYFRSEALRKSAHIQLQKGNRVEAQNYLKRALDEARRVEIAGNSQMFAICDVAVAQAEIGDVEAAEKTFEHALKLAKSYLDEPDMPYSLPTVAKAQAKAFGAEKPLEWVLKLPSPRHRVNSLTAIEQGCRERSE